MKCPFCGHTEQKVLDSRPARDGGAIRRRRECDGCGRRFTTFEEPERPRLMIVKRDGLREEFSHDKLLNSMVLACGKRPVSAQTLSDACDSIERDIYDSLVQEISTIEVGNMVMDALFKLDSVAYIRYASVYRAFENPEEFAEIVQRMQKEATPTNL